MYFLLAAAPEVMGLLFGPDYVESATVFRIYLLMLPIRIIMFGALLRATGHGRHILIQAVLTLIANLVLSWVGIRLFGPVGAAIATVAVVWIVAVPYLLVQFRRILHCPISALFPWQSMAKLHLAAGLPALVVLIAMGFCDLESRLVTVSLAAVVYGLIAGPLLAAVGLMDGRGMARRAKRVLAAGLSALGIH
jgi:O-antigen/teichoic acid export membrane protein